MIKVNYEDIKNKIQENYVQGLYFVTEYHNDTEKKARLSLALGKSVCSDEAIDTLTEMNSKGYNLYDYKSRNIVDNKIKNNLLLSKDNLPILKLEHFESKNSKMDYTDDTYIIYQEGNNRIGSKITITSLKAEDFEEVSVTVLDSDELFSKEYYQKKYHFTIKEDEILSLRIGNEMFLSGEEGFCIRCESALKCIGKVFSKVMKKVEATEIDVKEYKIQRH